MKQPWTREQVRAHVVALLSEGIGIPKEQIGDGATLDNELRMKSVAFVELQVAIEEMFDVQLDPIHVVELNQLGAIIDYVLETTMPTTRLPPGDQTCLQEIQQPIVRPALRAPINAKR